MASRQVWEQRIPGTDVALKRLHLEVDHEGRARLHEAVLARLLEAAGWLLVESTPTDPPTNQKGSRD